MTSALLKFQSNDFTQWYSSLRYMEVADRRCFCSEPAGGQREQKETREQPWRAAATGGEK